MDEITMQVSGICRKDGRKYAYVTFELEGGKKRAEGTIPDCRITGNTGFTDEEAAQLELFMKMNLGKLKKKAASIDPVRAMMGQTDAGSAGSTRKGNSNLSDDNQ